jgi:hypothetical protein
VESNLSWVGKEDKGMHTPTQRARETHTERERERERERIERENLEQWGLTEAELTAYSMFVVINNSVISEYKACDKQCHDVSFTLIGRSR